MRLHEITDDTEQRLLQNLNAALDAFHVEKDAHGLAAETTQAALQRVQQARQAHDAYNTRESEPTPPVIPDSDVRSPYDSGYKPRGGYTPEKIRRHLRANASLSSAGSLSKLYDDKGRSSFAREIRKFASPQEFAEHLFFHGTGGSVSGGLRPGSILPKGTVLGGGYGEPYSVISLSKSKNIASNFTGDSSHGSVYPVLVRKGAKVIAMPQIEDAQELEDILPVLWDKRVDVVKIGHWDRPHSEQELCVINPRAVIIGRGDSFAVFQKERFAEPTEDEIAEVYRQAFNKPAP